MTLLERRGVHRR